MKQLKQLSRNAFPNGPYNRKRASLTHLIAPAILLFGGGCTATTGSDETNRLDSTNRNSPDAASENPEDPGSDPLSSGGSNSSGETLSTGGMHSSTGGTDPSTGGSNSATGGSSASGGSTATDGASAYGGAWNDDDDPSVCTQVLGPGDNADSAIDAASPGDVICLRAGDYATVQTDNSGQDGAPITLRAYPGERHQARIEANGNGYSVRVENARYVEVEGLWLNGAQHSGFYVKDSDYIIGRFNRVTNVGQECMRFKRSDFGAFAYNIVETCGTKNLNGEGIYVGSGDESGDDTHGVDIVGNDVSDTTHEGIELKGHTSNVLVEGNRVHDLTCHDGGGIVVSSWDSAGPNSGHVIRGNIVWNVSTVTQWKDGNGFNVRRGAEVYNNVSFGNQHHGIRVDDKQNDDGRVDLHHNTFCDNGSSNFGIYDNRPVELGGNIGTDNSGNIDCDAALFVNASGGDYELAAGSGAADASTDYGVAFDLNDAPRPSGEGFDYGAFELQP